MDWNCYLDDHLSFPFRARCIAERLTSPFQPGDEIEVVGMAPETECDHEMFVMLRSKHRSLAVPLAQLEGVAVDVETRQALGDWRYWVERGHQLS